MRMPVHAGLAALLLLLMPGFANAQPWPATMPAFDEGIPVRYKFPDQLTTDLTFPAEPVARFPTAPRAGTVLGKPAGDGPFPGMVVFPTCDGVAPFVYGWGKSLVDDGYVTIVVDLFTQRGLKGTCFTSTAVNFQSAPTDALLAAEHLRKLPYVKADKIGFMGFSFGGTQGPLTEYYAERYGARGFQAVVSFYPPLLIPVRDQPGRYFRLIPERLKVPTLFLAGSADTETPPDRVTIPLLRPMKSAGDPVEWIIYPGGTHVFDDTAKAGRQFSGKGFHGEPVAYAYNAQITAQAWKDSFAFLARHLKN